MTRQQVAGWYPLLLATASIGVANSVVFSLLSDLQDKYRFPNYGLGLIAGTGFLVGFVGQILLAPLADRGHSKTLLIAGLAMAVLGSVFFALSSSLLAFVCSRAVVGLSNSLFLPASRAIAVTIEPGNVGHRLSVLGGVELAGFVTGPVLGGWLVGPFGVRVPFLAAGAFALAGGLMLLPRALPQPPLGPPRGLAFDLLRIPRIRAGVALSVALFVPVGFYDAVLDRYMTDRGASNTMIGFAFLAFGIPFAIVASFGGRLADRRGALRVGLISAVLVVPITVGYGFVTVPLVIVAMSAVEGIIQAIGSPASQAVVADGAPVGRAAAAQGLAGSMNLLVGAFTGYAAGTIYETYGSEVLFGIAGAGVLLFTAVAAAYGRRGAAPAAPPLAPHPAQIS
ncbi:MAG: MFS transporter [Ilumatobacteraceae bacterium]|nr:MFS transporter [Acidimicrobiaceae bacterium]MBP7887556.1 MFS transporter [Ilumatobacteraceae bacterium]MBP8208599.1 MFS transporter [Ilumatobacteraceae bacterium]MBP9052234.1 MFS transporter [Ilumatobacteraceae bacterium]HQY83754.1 MFS transporter [Ilumatobacteraceae bacterium]